MYFCLKEINDQVEKKVICTKMKGILLNVA